MSYFPQGRFDWMCSLLQINMFPTIMNEDQVKLTSTVRIKGVSFLSFLVFSSAKSPTTTVWHPSTFHMYVLVILWPSASVSGTIERVIEMGRDTHTHTRTHRHTHSHTHIKYTHTHTHTYNIIHTHANTVFYPWPPAVSAAHLFDNVSTRDKR